MLSFLSGWRKHTLPVPDEQEAAGALISSLLLMAWFVEARDPYTGGHLWRVSRYSRLLAEAAGLTAADVARVSLGGFLHDLGKIGITDAVLRKTSALDEQEYALIRTHPEMGARMLAGHPRPAWYWRLSTTTMSAPMAKAIPVACAALKYLWMPVSWACAMPSMP